jgi:3-deoxy-manno-octulosonate cytidylyltransferase (CMP-KDO synthetase)
MVDDSLGASRALANTSVLAVIPARYGSSRFPGKPLAELWGKPLLEHAWNAAKRVRGVQKVIIATDDQRIVIAAQRFNAIAERTALGHTSGTDRVAEITRRYPGADIIVNVQGDEPELDVHAVNGMVAGMVADPGIPMATLAHAAEDPSVFESEHVVKVGLDAGVARFFTRRWPPPGGGLVMRHIGVYGYRRDFLLEFTSWPESEDERRESLEQLRALERGVPIRVFESLRPSSGVDTPEQLAALQARGPGR